MIGRLFTSGLIDCVEDAQVFSFSEGGKEAHVSVKAGTGVKNSEIKNNGINNTTADRLHPMSWKNEWIFSLSESFANDWGLHSMTQCTHSCILAKKEEILYSCEDISRNNAADKAIGYAVINKTDMNDCILFTSGRVSADMVRKVIHAGIPVLVSKSVPTAEAADLSLDSGLVLICRAHPDSFVVL